jgi:hypothetical protein
MRTVSVQFHSRRAPDLDARTVSELMLRVALNAGVRVFLLERPRSAGYFNFLFVSATPVRSWRAVQTLALRHRRLGGRLRRSTIVACQGSRGWRNYHLLHHFDTRQPLDRLTGV